ncbi:MAG: hypothetical protein K2K86_03320, partial [Muribaculaceae bacterium]|nr:hypothetical protein [Muribaculaceae bacterium]
MNKLLSKITLTVAIIASVVTQINAKDISANLKSDLKLIESSDTEEIRLGKLSSQDAAADELAATTSMTRTV